LAAVYRYKPTPARKRHFLVLPARLPGCLAAPRRRKPAILDHLLPAGRRSDGRSAPPGPSGRLAGLPAHRDRHRDWLEAEVSDIRIHLDAAGALGATVRFDQPLLGSLVVPVSVTEGIILAWRRQYPLRVHDATREFIKRSLQPAEPALRARPIPPGQPVAPGIREFIESLDFGPADS
jgi:hypothetical protein